ncbi:bifunctional hydroxymethylpyrimidine kinase/phosphomethylpyrimidine kinase [Dyadobacter sp. CY345]|uniref:bifunctional hydroxymethylpyrimidine kinase/phosphomethylpyrimidine kinase n=1 Tax=Dyadobacter sp. CY345 TaxID=2909335 RepID=UPI001F20504D|nr:bifunctional hydroxymethylpyrimidine kinase/phosphomethylpyrimidine kinase [Dyadobacter sp. CY345]MCF2442862.1 bifunctional hydroxymethylpyrimidine kinase/phosphomethylpyrimidine kinase [Dyadobacter sp. CY345]
MKRYPTVLTIAGSDSGGGAGIQADLKTIAALGAYGTSAITALTAQNTLGVRGIHAVPSAFLKSQLEAVFEDIKVDAVKIGMINTIEAARIIAEVLDRFQPEFVVFDPVMVSTSGAKLIQDETIEVLWEELFPRATIVTPNLDEAQILVGHKITNVDKMIEASKEMVNRGCQGVLLKGGHLIAPKLFDVFLQKKGDPRIFESEYIESKNVHGTGCTLSSAIATYAALGNTLSDSILLAKQYVAGAIEAGKNITTGSGSGPLNHSFSAQVMHVISM